MSAEADRKGGSPMNPRDRHDWRLFRGDGMARHVEMPPAPPWRRFGGGEQTVPDGEQTVPDGEQTVPDGERALSASGPAGPAPYLISPEHADVVNAALHLRRPLLVT
ncbi:hypothetical protein KN815_25970, partial [Streptomyces sp. 4503]|nr:hypothetical protein [Streptomyces niphimycinicus]